MRSLAENLKTPWQRMIAVDLALMLALFAYKLFSHFPTMQYLHLVVDYHFGFTKRALIGAIVGLAVPVVPTWLVFAIGGAAWLAALALFLLLFRRTFGFSQATAPLFAFLFGSPFFFKNFIQIFGYFDIFGCIGALAMLLIPARSFWYVGLGALLCVVLILIHPVHMLLYVPTIGLIVGMRYHFPRGFNAPGIAAGLGLAAIVAAVFVASAFYGQMPVPKDQLIEHLRSRVADPQILTSALLNIWYLTIADEIWMTWSTMPANALRFPIYALLIALHWPVIAYGRRLIAALEQDWQRRLTLLGIAGIAIGYLIIGAVVYDYSRWLSNWGVCMILVLHAIKMLPARATAAPIADDKWTRRLGWVITVLPRVGTTKPF